jgi:hypothetical protein
MAKLQFAELKQQRHFRDGNMFSETVFTLSAKPLTYFEMA